MPDLHVDTHVDFDTSDVGWFAGLLCSWGLTGVPVNITFTILFLIGWIISYFSSFLLTSLLLDGAVMIMAGIAIMFVAFAIAIVMTARCIRPLKKMFHIHEGVSKAAFVGSVCIISTTEVTEDFGQAVFEYDGSEMRIRVHCKETNNLKKGSRASIIGYDPEQDIYEVVAELII